MPGTLRGCEPVATMISLRRGERLLVAFGDLDLASCRPGGRYPLIQSILFFGTAARRRPSAT